MCPKYVCAVLVYMERRAFPTGKTPGTAEAAASVRTSLKNAPDLDLGTSNESWFVLETQRRSELRTRPKGIGQWLDGDADREERTRFIVIDSM